MRSKVKSSDSEDADNSSSDESSCSGSDREALESIQQNRILPVTTYLPMINLENLNNNMRCSTLCNNDKSVPCSNGCNGSDNSKRKDNLDSLNVRLEALREANMMRLTDSTSVDATNKVPDSLMSNAELTASKTKVSQTDSLASVTKKRRKKNRKQRSKINASQGSSGSVMSSTIVLKNTASVVCPLEAFGRHVSVLNMPLKEKKPQIDYRKFANETITSSLKALGVSHNSPKVFHKRRKSKQTTNESTHVASCTPPASGKEHRKFIQKLHEKQMSIYGNAARVKAATVTGSASAESITQPRTQAPSNEAGFPQKRFLTFSAPTDNAQQTRKIKVYLSDKNSKDSSECGQDFPCPPPPSPCEGCFDGVEFVAPLADLRSQRALRTRLESLRKIDKQRQEKMKVEKERQDKLRVKERARELRKRQRREIYALNAVMTEFENNNFIEFCRKNGIPIPDMFRVAAAANEP